MATTSHRFDPYLGRIHADGLKKMVRLWGGRSQLRKNECLAVIQRGLNSESQIRAALATLTPLERTAMALLKQLGGESDANALAVALRASGYVEPERGRRRRDNGELVQSLVKRGLILGGAGHYDPARIRSSSLYSRAMVFTDERILAHVTWSPETKPVKLKPVAVPPAALSRRPSAVALDIIGVLQAMDNLGGLGLTQTGTLRVTDVRKMNKALGWDRDSTVVDGVVFPEPATAFAYALLHSGLSQVRNDAFLALTTTPERFAQLPYGEQVRGLLYGFTHATEWSEWAGFHQISYNARNLSLARLSLVMLLAALPDGGETFFSINALDAAMFERIGEYFDLRGYAAPQPLWVYGKSPEEERQIVEEWRQKLRDRWLTQETLWLKSALTTWLYYLGIVAVGMDNGTPVSFRLTELGRSVLQDAPISSSAPSKDESQPAWIVQPNLEVLVYLEHVNPEQLVFLEQHAARVDAQQHTARYSLTSETVYQALEKGSTLESVLVSLQAGAGAPLPQNVTVELREWAARRERMSLYRRARLLEFADTVRRDAALDAGLSGTAVGERFVLLSSEAALEASIAYVDYAKPLSRCLSAIEDGTLTLLRTGADLVIEGELDLWAERRTAETWQLTADSVRAALRAGARIEEALAWLSARLTGVIPPWLRVALLAWSGMAVQTHLAEVVVLQCSQREVFDAIVDSPALRPLLRGVLTPELVLVDPAALEMLRAYMSWAEFAVVDMLKVKRR